jgi:hypothetical protein
VVFDGLQPSTEDQVHIRSYILDSKSCLQLCEEFSTAKSYFYNQQSHVCQCLLKTLAENEEHILKIGARQGCEATFVQKTCVSSHHVSLYKFY